jgi:hypothetical protein
MEKKKQKQKSALICHIHNKKKQELSINKQKKNFLIFFYIFFRDMAHVGLQTEKMFEQIMFIKNAPLKSLPSAKILILTIVSHAKQKKPDIESNIDLAKINIQ